MLETVEHGKKAWDSATFSSQEEFTFHFSEATIGELKQHRDKLQSVVDAGGGAAFDASLFPALRKDINTYRTEYLEGGYGIGLLAGVEGFTLLEQQNIYWLICNFLGRPLVQNSKDEIFVTVQNRGQSMDSGGRYHDTKEGGSLHTDSPQYAQPPHYLGLLCYHPAQSGGESIFVSSYTVHNKILEKHPSLLRLLYENFHFDKRGDFKEGESATTVAPVFTYTDGKLTFRYLRKYMEAGASTVGIDVTDGQIAAMDAVDAEIDDASNRIFMTMKAGQMQFVNNDRVIHGRTAFEDYEAPEKKRILLRAWVARS